MSGATNGDLIVYSADVPTVAAVSVILVLVYMCAADGEWIAFIHTLLSKMLYSIASRSPIHTPTAGGLGGVLLRDTSTLGGGTSNLPVARQPLLPPELLPPPTYNSLNGIFLPLKARVLRRQTPD